MGAQQASKTVRRRVALARSLVRDAAKAAPPELRKNLNRLITVALREYVERRRQAEFRADMDAMAADPAIRAECAAIDAAFRVAEIDGLPRGPGVAPRSARGGKARRGVLA